MERNHELLQRIDKKLNNIDKKINVEFEQILKKCEDSKEEYENVEMLLKALMVDSLIKEIEEEDGADGYQRT